MVIHFEDNKDKQNRKYKKNGLKFAELNNVQTHYTEHRNGKEIYMRNSWILLLFIIILVMIIRPKRSIDHVRVAFLDFAMCLCVFFFVASMWVCVHKLFSAQLWNGLKGERLGY